MHYFQGVLASKSLFLEAYTFSGSIAWANTGPRRYKGSIRRDTSAIAVNDWHLELYRLAIMTNKGEVAGSPSRHMRHQAVRDDMSNKILVQIC